MTKRTKWIVLGVAALGAAGLIAVFVQKGSNQATLVREEKVGKRDLIASVTASGQVQPHTKVDVASDVSGRIVRLAVKEGEMVKKGQFLLQIDPATYEAEVQRSQAAVASARAEFARTKAASTSRRAPSTAPRRSPRRIRRSSRRRRWSSSAPPWT